MTTNQAGQVKLSRREAHVLRLLAAGQITSNQQIADRLDLSERTVAGYIEQLREGLQVATRTTLVVWVWQNPGALRGEWCNRRLHPEGCSCGTGICGEEAA